MKSLFTYLKNCDDITLISSCVFHYELEFIHPFDDGNGRMGRLWQTKILMEEHPVFEFIPIEHVVLKTQKDYYKALSDSDKHGKSTPFIEFMLDSISDALNDMLSITNVQDTFTTRIEKSKVELGDRKFNRLDYMKIHKHISPATASRDLRKAVNLNMLNKKGEKSTTVYQFK